MSRPNCCGCGTNGRRGKLLRCLHTLCVGCLQQFVSQEGSIACPHCSRPTIPTTRGRSLIESLPDSYSALSASAAACAAPTPVAPPPILCDECGKDEPAVATCADCNTNFCKIHARAHPLSRAFLDHRVGEVQKAPSAVRTTVGRSCPFHPSHPLISFCEQCEELLCECCAGKSVHQPHAKRVLPLEQVAAERRKIINGILEEKKSSDDGVLQRALGEVQGSLGDIHDRTEQVSTKITEYFDEVAAAAAKRKEDLLTELDQLRTLKIGPLEREKAYMEAVLKRGETVAGLMETPMDEINFLKMSRWLQEAAWESGSGFDERAAQLTQQPISFVFEPGVRELADVDVLNIVRSAGVVADCIVDIEQSTLECPQQVTLQNEVLLVVAAVAQSGELVSAEQAAAAQLCLQVRSPDGKAMLLQPSGVRRDGCLVAKYQATLAGYHQVSALVTNRHLTNSPALMIALDRYTFHPDRHDPAVLLSNDNQTARRLAVGDGFRSVCGSRLPDREEIEIRVRLDNAPSDYMFLCLCSAARPTLDNCHQGATELYGWHASMTHKARRWCNGSCLGQPWRVGDVISITYNRREQTVTGRNERSGDVEVLNQVVARQLCLYISMTTPGQQFTIVGSR